MWFLFIIAEYTNINISVHSGTTTGDVKMNFGRFERARYKKYLVPIFGNFLMNCYSKCTHMRV